jgi:hypothetical protein
MRTVMSYFHTKIVDGLLTVEGTLAMKRTKNAIACAVSAEVWHKRLGHVDDATLTSMHQSESVVGKNMKS